MSTSATSRASPTGSHLVLAVSVPYSIALATPPMSPRAVSVGATSLVAPDPMTPPVASASPNTRMAVVTRHCLNDRMLVLEEAAVIPG
ncbi:hypothetical protein [Nocardioides piscis]|uniref:Uncharacterized protein n=1 Tax=Nocardioides piscis TaxID=2714938 RepID=A0A6G7YJH2_9ACTN|nr:hypothetical protein [Nocardioides piscis]QIK76885.1 hypothetical protein G7071_17040 [Nocardioides piscis]